jgi:AcrR family transcriptional regulator
MPKKNQSKQISIKPRTRERILDASLTLFNDHGYQNIPLLKIARHMNISHGNLAYHFKSKADIVMAVFPTLEEAVRRARAPEGGLLARDAATHQAEVFRTLWRYRFFFNALTQLLSRDAKLKRRFMALQENILRALEDLLDGLIRHGCMRDVKPPTTTRMLARCCWMTWLSWLRFEQIENPTLRVARKAAVFDGVMLNFSIVQAYFSESFAAEMLTELKQNVLGAKSVRQ